MEDVIAKALFGYVGGPDPRLVDEVRRLRRHVSDLELQVARLQAKCEQLAATESVQQLLDAEVIARARSDVPETAGALH